MKGESECYNTPSWYWITVIGCHFDIMGEQESFKIAPAPTFASTPENTDALNNSQSLYA